MAQEMNTPIWEVMLQSAQVINQVAEGQRRMQIQQQQLELEKQRNDDLARAREETLAQRERALEYKKAADEADNYIKSLRAQTYEFDVRSRAEDRDFLKAQKDEQLEWQKTKEQLKTATSSAEAKDVTTAGRIKTQLWDDAEKIARFADQSMNMQHANLLGLTNDQLASREKQLLPNNALDEVMAIELAKKYPVIRGSEQLKMEERKAIAAIFRMRNENYLLQLNRAAENYSPGVNKILKLSLPGNARNEAIYEPVPGTQQVPAKSQAIQSGLKSMAPTPGQALADTPPVELNQKMVPILDQARRVSLMPQNTPEAKKARVQAAADVVQRTIQSVSGPEQRTAKRMALRELIGAAPNADDAVLMSNELVILVNQALQERGLVAPKGAPRATSGSMKG